MGNPRPFLTFVPCVSRQEKLDFFLQSRTDLPFLFPMAIGDVTANMLLGSSSATAPPKNRLVEMLVVRHGSRGAPPCARRSAAEAETAEGLSRGA